MLVLPPLVNLLGIFANSLKFVAAVLTGDWQGAWTAARDIAVGAITHFVNVYNSTLAKLPGMPEIDVSKLTASLTTADEALADTGTAATDMASEAGTATSATATSVGKATTIIISAHHAAIVDIENRAWADRVKELVGTTQKIARGGSGRGMKSRPRVS